MTQRKVSLFTIGARVRVNDTFPYEGRGRVGTVMYAGRGRKAPEWIGVKFDDSDSEYLAEWHKSYFDLIS